ncbi:MAG: hypothetical protein IJX90_11315 [Blautia sp.]|nr:hypothetical protein [Blautia sp.]
MSDVKLRIDTRYFRMCIHRQALKAIGDPLFLHFGYAPETTRLLIVGSWVDDRKSVRVRYDNSGSVYVFSKPLLQGIRQVSHVLMDRASYIVEGTAQEADRILIFPLGQAEVISEE